MKRAGVVFGAAVAILIMANAEGASALAVAQPEKAGNQKPFVRDVTTGYLLNCSFLSPRPYCWKKKETVMLSGWDVDKSGGTFEYKPNAFSKRTAARLEGVKGEWQAQVLDQTWQPVSKTELKADAGGSLNLNLAGPTECHTVVLTKTL